MTSRLFALSSIALIFLACACSSAPVHTSIADQTGLGMSKEKSIEVCKPEGERNYLARLVCPDSSHPRFNRIGRFGFRQDFPAGMSEEDQMKVMTDSMGFEKLEPGAVDYHTIDGYSIECGKTKTTLYLDMYHCDVPAPSQAPVGFSITN